MPQTQEGPIPVMACGDGATVITMTRAKRAIGNGLYEDGCCRFRGLTDSAEEFHKQGIIMQDMNNALFDPRSGSDEGTLANFKEVFKLQNALTRGTWSISKTCFYNLI